jgi:hypothetical protein
MPKIGPVVLSTQGDEFIDGARIEAVIWEGATTSGDVAKLICRGTGSLLWKGRTDGVQTYIGGNLGPKGVHAPYGFKADPLPAGTIMVYLMEN